MEHESAPRRDFVFAIIVFLANAYLIAFAADGALSLFDELFRSSDSDGPMHGLREGLSEIVIAFSFVMLLLAVLFPRLPKLVLLPMAAFAAWCGFGAPPLVWAGNDQASAYLVLSLAQVVIFAGAVSYIKARTGCWFLKTQGFLRKPHALWRIALAGIAALAIVPLFLASLLVMSVASMIQTETHGYIQFTSKGINLQQTVLERGSKTVRLIGMLHIGEPRFYDALYASFPRGGLILEEGATDRAGRLSGNLSYRRFAAVLGLTQQPRLSNPGAPSIDRDHHANENLLGAKARGLHVIDPDIDVSEFSETTIRFLIRVGEIYQSTSLFDLFARVTKAAEEATPDELSSFYEDVVHKRNRRVLAAFDANIVGYDSVVVPWGALHMPELERSLEQRGFKVVSRQRLPLLEYATILRQALGSPS